MSGDVEGMLVEHAGLRDVELLVAGHHGSASSTSQALLNALQPETAILSVGRDNAYGHPAPETLERLAARGCGDLSHRPGRHRDREDPVSVQQKRRRECYAAQSRRPIRPDISS